MRKIRQIATFENPVANPVSLTDHFVNIAAREGLMDLPEPYRAGFFRAMHRAYKIGKDVVKKEQLRDGVRRA